MMVDGRVHRRRIAQTAATYSDQAYTTQQDDQEHKEACWTRPSMQASKIPSGSQARFLYHVVSSQASCLIRLDVEAIINASRYRAARCCRRRR